MAANASPSLFYAEVTPKILAAMMAYAMTWRIRFNDYPRSRTLGLSFTYVCPYRIARKVNPNQG